MTSDRDPLALLDDVKTFAESLNGAIAVLVAEGWTPDQARELIIAAMRLQPPR
jgi:hypothetical protein